MRSLPKIDMWENGCGAYVGKNKITFTKSKSKKNRKELIYVFPHVDGKIRGAEAIIIKSRNSKELIGAIKSAKFKYELREMLNVPWQ